jgi:alpha-beta hydrolase superfamily lysophospholipase
LDVDDREAEPRPVWFGPEETPIFGLVDVRAREVKGAVVLCYPLGREHLSAYGTFARLASRLADLGFLVLRFDYRSTGDSFDRVHSGTSPSQLLEDVRDAIDFVRSLGAAHVSIAGMRVGALLAALAAATEPLANVVMWDPCTKGRSFIRAQRVLSLGVPSSGMSGSEPEGVPGQYLPPEIMDEVSTLQLEEGSATLANRVLVLTRQGSPLDRKLVDPLVLPRAEYQEVAGQPELLDKPTPFQVVPHAALASIVDWFEQAAPSSKHPVCLPETDGFVVAPWPGADVDTDALIVEQPVRLGPKGLFGISSQPKEGPEGPVFLFVSVANEHRIGPGRLWVELSRRLTTAGYQSLRLDLGGSGDSPGPRLTPEDIYSYRAVDDVVQAARAVTGGDPSNVVLVGLCSGGYHALEAAVRLLPQGVYAINPSVFFPPPEAEGGGAINPGRHFNLPMPSGATIRGKVVSMGWVEQWIPPVRWAGRRFPEGTMRARRLGRGAVDAAGRPFRRISWWVRSRRGSTNDGPAAGLAQLARNGTDVFLICGPEEMRPFAQAPDLLGSPTDRSRLHLEVIPPLDHALRRPSDREHVIRAILAHLDQQFGAGFVSGHAGGPLDPQSP